MRVCGVGHLSLVDKVATYFNEFPSLEAVVLVFDSYQHMSKAKADTHRKRGQQDQAEAPFDPREQFSTPAEVGACALLQYVCTAGLVLSPPRE